MSFWNKVLNTLRDLAKRGTLRPEALQKLKEVNQQVAFTIALISLCAKMAKADGRVTKVEVRAFKAVFKFRKEDEKMVAKVFNLAQKTIAGFEGYASSVAKLYEHDPRVRDDVMEALFQIAAADTHISSIEKKFLWRVHEIFKLSERSFHRRLHRFTINEERDPYVILGVNSNDSNETIRNRWKELIKQSHPDILMARGVPSKSVKLIQSRVADYNQSWDEIKQMRGI